MMVQVSESPIMRNQPSQADAIMSTGLTIRGLRVQVPNQIHIGIFPACGPHGAARRRGNVLKAMLVRVSTRYTNTSAGGKLSTTSTRPAVFRTRNGELRVPSSPFRDVSGSRLVAAGTARIVRAAFGIVTGCRGSSSRHPC